MAKTVKVNAEEFAQRWGAGLKANVEKIRTGVNRVEQSPGVAAAAAADKWYAAISDTSTRDKWARRLRAMTLEDWKTAMLQKGVNRIAAGADAAQGKVAAYGEKLIAHQNRLLSELDGMPDVTLEDSISRMTAWVRGMARLEV